MLLHSSSADYWYGLWSRTTVGGLNDSLTSLLIGARIRGRMKLYRVLFLVCQLVRFKVDVRWPSYHQVMTCVLHETMLYLHWH
jgi:hypothetical protein